MYAADWKPTRRNDACSPPSATKTRFGQLGDYNDVGVDNAEHSNQNMSGDMLSKRKRALTRMQGRVFYTKTFGRSLVTIKAKDAGQYSVLHFFFGVGLVRDSRFTGLYGTIWTGFSAHGTPQDGTHHSRDSTAYFARDTVSAEHHGTRFIESPDLMGSSA